MAPRQIAVAATGAFGADVLERLAAEHDVVQLLTRPDKPRGRGRRVASPPARDVAERLGIPALHPERLDAGPIAARRAFPVAPGDDAGAVYARAAEVAAELLRDVLAKDEPRFAPQSEEGVTYAEKIRPEDRELDPAAPPAQLVNRVRALSPHIGARLGDLMVWRARVGDDGSFEPVEVQPSGGRRMVYD